MNSEVVGPPRVAKCALQLEAKAVGLTPGGEGQFFRVECEVLRVHADERIVVPGTHHVDPSRWSPPIFSFRRYHGLAPDVVRHGFRSETAKSTTRAA